jgi:penicillin-binding protein 1A
MRAFFNYFLESSDRPLFNRLVKLLWLTVIGGIASIIVLFTALSFTDLPSVKELENPQTDQASQVFASSGEVLGRYYTENRVPVGFDELSPYLVQALIATEDERFYQHTGIDFPALGRVMVKTVLLGQKSSGGASTITQQLAKLLFTGQKASSIPKRVFQKLKEWIIAIRLERKYTKEEILAMYLNKFNFINGAYGIKAAAEIYFNKSQYELTPEEAAMLVGMLKNPSLFNPLRRPEAVLQRRMVVLNQMVKNNYLTTAQYDSLKNIPLNLQFTRQSHIDGPAPYFRMELAKYLKEILDKPENLKSDGTPYNIYRDGLRVYTTIDADMQRIAEDVMFNVHMPKVQKTFFDTWKRMDPWTYKNPESDLEIPLEVRKESLKSLMRESERYQQLRDAYLLDILDIIQSELDFVFHEDDREIERMVRETQKKGYLDGLVKDQLISQDLAKAYREVMQHAQFSGLVSAWEELQKATEQQFNQPVSMKVFAYNNEMEKDTVMTPLDSIKYHRMFLQTGILAVDPISGQVKVWVGGINHKYFQYDHIRINRQVGSTFKPFVYATAIAQQGFSPCYQVYDLPVTIAPGDGNFQLLEPWTPRNSDGTYTGELLTLKEGLKQSKNTVSVHLMKELGDSEPVRDLINQMGIDKNGTYANGRLRVPRAPSICLGATDLSVMEMTGAYTTFANNGIYNKPTFITRIEDKNGRVIYEELPEERVALDAGANYVMVDMLKYAGTALGALQSETGGKTGTTNDYVDGWFMGITPGLVVGTWVGGEDRWIRFRSLTYGQGSYMAKPFFREFIKRLEDTPNIDYDPTLRFHVPPGDLGIELDCGEYEAGDLFEEFESTEFEGAFSNR